MSSEKELDQKDLILLREKWNKASDEIRSILIEMKRTTLAGFFEEGVETVENGMQLLANKLEAMMNLKAIVNDMGVGEEDGFFTLLPNETKMHIFSFLNYKDLAHLSLVCKQWRGVSDMEDSQPYSPNIDEESNADSQNGGFIDILWHNLFFNDLMESSDLEDGVTSRLGGPSAVTVTASSIWTGAPELFLSKGLFCWTQNQPHSWFMVDYGPNVLVTPNSYTFLYASSGAECCPRNWVLQGAVTYDKELENTEDPSKSQQWDILSEHINDTTITTAFTPEMFKLKDIKKGYRYFRLLQTGPNSYVPPPGDPDKWSNVLVAAGFELFGKITSLQSPHGEESNYLSMLKPYQRSWKWLYKSRKIKFNGTSVRNGPGTYDDGSESYSGDWKDNKKDGFGTLVQQNGNLYKGWWKDNQRHGRGLSLTEAENGGKIKYVGEWECNEPHGQGQYIWENYGDQYNGQWKHGQKHGYGTFRWSEGDQYQGEWQNDMLFGKGVFKWSNDGSFEGEFENDDVASGSVGVLTFADGTRWSGKFKGPFSFKKREGTSLLFNQMKRYVTKNESQFVKDSANK